MCIADSPFYNKKSKGLFIKFLQIIKIVYLKKETWFLLNSTVKESWRALYQ
jgi:hypothetical protein